MWYEDYSPIHRPHFKIQRIFYSYYVVCALKMNSICLIHKKEAFIILFRVHFAIKDRQHIKANLTSEGQLAI